MKFDIPIKIVSNLSIHHQCNINNKTLFSNKAEDEE